MDRNQATGLILIALMLMGYFMFFKPDVPPQENQVETQVADESVNDLNTIDSTTTTIQATPCWC